MSVANTYKTVAKQGISEIEEKKSKFIAHVFPVANEEEAASYISLVKKKHYNATHNVFAVSIGLKGEYVKANDDGEPSGTAGMPILDILRREKICNTLIVVTRYFGGILLGTGGLVRAYGRAAKEGLNDARVIVRTLCTKFELSVDYHLFGKIQYAAEQEQFKVFNTAYTDIVTLTMVIEAERRESFLKLVSDVCKGCELLEEIGVDYYDL